MKKILIYTFSVILLFASTISCKDYLEITPKSILVDDQIWGSEDMVLSVLANLYNRIPVTSTIYSGNDQMSNYDDLMWTGLYEDNNQFQTYGWNFQNYWDWNYIRDLNDFIEKATKATKLNAAKQKLFIAEGRFLRAYAYFEFVKKMGGVPLVTTTSVYSDFLKDPDSFKKPRNKESEIYDFVASEVDAITEDLTLNATSQTRATKWTALALKCRAMLYAGSLARYNNLMATPITTTDGEVGIPSSMAAGYYQKALDAAELIITSTKYSLYTADANKADNFYKSSTYKSPNPEVIFAKDFTTGYTHNFTTYCIIRALREDAAEASRLSPTLGFVESFEYTTGFDGTLRNKDAGNNYILYNNMMDIFANKDPRLFGTVLVPGSTFKGKDVGIQAGVAVWTGSAYTLTNSSTIGTTYTDGGVWTGASGPLGEEIHTANTGFGMRKFISDKAGDAIRSTGNLVWWPFFKYDEVLLNAAEAAFELTQTTKALGYINQVRTRAGMPSLDAGTLTINRIMNERRVELAFEDLRWWDLKRFRTAHILLDGGVSVTSEHWALWPYRVYSTVDPTRNNKYIFVKMKAPRQRTFNRLFRLGNYYGQFTDTYISKNPQLVKNPNQN
jgi:hypothetical protein